MNWDEKRLTSAQRLAETQGDPENWRRLRNLAAAYGRLELAREAEKHYQELNESSLSVDQEIVKIVSSADKSRNVPISFQATTSGPAPIARMAWLKRIVTRAGARFSQSEGFSVIRFTGAEGEHLDWTRVRPLLEQHPEVDLSTCEGEEL